MADGIINDDLWKVLQITVECFRENSEKERKAKRLMWLIEVKPMMMMTYEWMMMMMKILNEYLQIPDTLYGWKMGKIQMRKNPKFLYKKSPSPTTLIKFSKFYQEGIEIKIPSKKWGSNIIPRNCPSPNQVRSKVTFTSSLTEGPWKLK